MQRDRIAIAGLELEAANLIRRREEVAESITRDVVELVLNYEQLDRQIRLRASQHATQQQRQAIMEAAYRTGTGSTNTMLTVWQRTEDIAAQLAEQRITQAQYRHQLEHLTQSNRALPVDYHNGVVPSP